MKKILAVILTGIIAVSSITMVSATSSTELIGDANNDGAVSIEDATTIQKYLASIIDLDEKSYICADTDGNGAVSIEDATTVQKYLAGIISDFPANQPEPTEPEIGNIIPEGGQVILNGNTYNAGEEFPANETGMIFTYGDYEYMYNGGFCSDGWNEYNTQNGWGVRVKDDSQEVYGEILSEIAGKPVTNMSYTFYNTFLETPPTIPSSVTNMSHTFMCCTYLTTAPTIPENVTDMRYTFWSCDNLTTAPKIPSSVTNIYCTFQYCRSLTGEVEINAINLDYYDYCFDGTSNPITLTGTCPILYTIASQYSNVSTSAPEPTTAPTQPTTKPTEKPTEPTTKPGTVTPNEMELEILRLVNVERAKLGRKELKFGDFYYEAAKVRAKEIDTYFSHTRPDGSGCFTVLEPLGLSINDRYAGENCARYFNDAETVVKRFMNSEAHRQNIMYPKFDYLAVAVYESKEYPGYYTVEQLFLSDEIDWDNYE